MIMEASRRGWETLLWVQVVEELLSRSGALGKETAKSIADAAMLEVAGISMGHMVLMKPVRCLFSEGTQITLLSPPHRSLMNSTRE